MALAGCPHMPSIFVSRPIVFSISILTKCLLYLYHDHMPSIFVSQPNVFSISILTK